jgi:hypothetical protein
VPTLVPFLKKCSFRYALPTIFQFTNKSALFALFAGSVSGFHPYTPKNVHALIFSRGEMACQSARWRENHAEPTKTAHSFTK